MTYSTAKARIVTMAEAVTGFSRVAQYGQRFAHYPSGTFEVPPPSRGFIIRALARAHNSTSNPGPPRRTFADVRLSFFYRRADGNPSELDDVIAEDYDLFRAYFLTTSNWNRPTSTIITLWRDGPEMLPAAIEETDDHVIQAIDLAIEHTTQTA